MHKLTSFVILNNLRYNKLVSRIIEHLHLRGLLFGKLTVRGQSIEKIMREQSVSKFTLYLTRPVTANTSTVAYITQLVPAGNMEDAKYKSTTNSVFMLLYYLLKPKKKISTLILEYWNYFCHCHRFH
jgi:hypothetical protein